MPRPLLACSAICLLAASTAAQAEPTYSFVEGAVFLNKTDTPPFGEHDGKGLNVRFSYDVLSYLHVFAGAKKFEFDDLPVDETKIQAGAGVHYSHSERTSIYFDLGLLKVEASASAAGASFSADEDGYTYAFGYRELTKTGRTEFNLSAEHIELTDSDTGDTWVNLGLLYKITPRFKLTTSVQFAGDENMFRAGVRYDLPNRFSKR